MTSRKFTMLQAAGLALVRSIQFAVRFARDVHGSWLYIRYGKPQLPEAPQRPVAVAIPSRQQAPTCVPESNSTQVQAAGQDPIKTDKTDQTEPDLPQKGSRQVGATEKAFAVSERVRTSTVVASGVTMGVLWLYLYPSESKARRVFKVLDKGLARALGFSRYYYPDVPYDPVEGADKIMSEFKGLVAGQLDRRPATAKVRGPKGEKPQKAREAAEQTRKVREAMAALAPKTRQQEERAQPPATAPLRPAPEQDSHSKPLSFDATVPDVVAPAHMRRVRGTEQVGVITSSGVTQRPDGRGGTYKTFCMTLHDGAVEVPLFGVELERQARDLGLRVGESVKVVSMGRQTVDGEDGSKFKKNLYQVTRVSP